MRTTKFLQGISDISDSYTGFIIDTWGVLHNGKDVYEGAIDCLRELKARKKFILILSNTINRNEAVLYPLLNAATGIFGNQF